MKILFVFMSCMLAVTLSVLAAIVATGIVPFREDSKDEEKVVPSVEAETANLQKTSVSVFAGQATVVDELVKQLKDQIERQKESEKKLAADRKELEHKMLQMKTLEENLAALKAEVSDKIVQISTNEESNFKKLAEMYAKMDPESAAELLQKSDPDRAAKIISLIADRQAAAIMTAAVGAGDGGVTRAALWSDAMRRMNNQKNAQL